jgi:hypothetical protein
MSYVLLSAKNAQTIIDDNCGINKFYKVANLLQDNLSIRFINQVDDIELLNWDFSYKNKFLTLQFSVYGGVSLKESYNANSDLLISNELEKYIHSKVY